MAMKRWFLFASIFMFFLPCCSKKAGDLPITPPAEKRISAVCIVDDAIVRDQPNLSGKRLTSASLGEQIIWLGVSETDTSKESREYYQIELSDSTRGWITAFAVQANAAPGIIVEQTNLYRRPDLLTLTEQNLEEMDFVAVLATDSDWLQIVGENRRQNGWIRRVSVSLRPEDIAVGVLTQKAKRIKDHQKREKSLIAIVENPSFANSVFISHLIELLNDMKEND
ncbi:MAG: SH3 domain-containing protein [Calditrichaeota bacterium]|nr:MAG: SH3 domain-containing protein [Calditrichota bacterium]